MLTSFKDAQKALEGESYVNLSLLPLVIHNLDDQLKLCQAAADEETQGGLFLCITSMIDDFNACNTTSILSGV